MFSDPIESIMICVVCNFTLFFEVKISCQTLFRAFQSKLLMHANRLICDNCGTVDECVQSMLYIHFREKNSFVLPKSYLAEVYIEHAHQLTTKGSLLFYPSPISRKCILSMLINLPQKGLYINSINSSSRQFYLVLLMMHIYHIVSKYRSRCPN